MKGAAPMLGDPEIRAALLARLQLRHHPEHDVALMEELGICSGQVFIDVTVVNGSLHGYEIKSDRDSLRRLAGQVELYGRVLDRATLVVGTRHADDADELVPAWWEILIADVSGDGVRLRRRRRGRSNPTRDSRALVELLWLEDALALLEAREAVRGYRGRPRRDVWDRVCEVYDLDEVAHAVRAQLKARSARRSLPPCA